MSRRILLLAAAAILTGLAFSGCSDDSDSTPPPSSTAKIRVVHASPDAGLIDIYIGTTSVTPWLEDVAYGTASTYLSRDSGTIVLVMRQADADPSTDPGTTSDPIDMASGASLTALVAGLVGSNAPEDEVRLAIYSDNFQNSPTARARVVHAGSDAPNVTVSVGATTQVLANDLARWAESGRDGNVYDTGVIQDIVVEAEIRQVTSFRAPALEAQKDYYFILIGLISGPGVATAPFDLLIVGPGGALDLEETTPRDFRLIDAIPDAAPFDPYLVYGFGDGQTRVRITEGLGYGEVTPYDEVTVRQIYIEIYEQGANPHSFNVLYSQPVYIHDESSSTTIVAAGLSDTSDEEAEARLFSLADDFGTSPMGTLSARVVHACPNLDHLSVYFDGITGLGVTASRFTGNTEGPFTLSANETHTMEVRRSGLGTLVDFFITPAMAEDKDYYLVLTGIKDGMPGFELLSVNEDGSQGFTPPNR